MCFLYRLQNCVSHSTVKMDYNTTPLNDWTEDQVAQWLLSININKKYIDKLTEEEVYGPVLKEIDEEFLKKNIGMKQVPIKLLIKKRDELLVKYKDASADLTEENSQRKSRSNTSKTHPDYSKVPLNEWTEDHVAQWLQSILINKKYIDKLIEEEIYGPGLKVIDEEFLSKNIDMKQGPISLFIKKRDELLLKHYDATAGLTETHNNAIAGLTETHNSTTGLTETHNNVTTGLTETHNNATTGLTGKNSQDKSGQNVPKNYQCTLETRGTGHPEGPEITIQTEKRQLSTNTEFLKSDQTQSLSKTQDKVTSENKYKSEKNMPRIKSESISVANFRPFDKEVKDFKYKKNEVLPPETGVEDLIVPCHEYKSLDNAAKLDRVRLQAKFAYELIRFASACMNMRTNGTIHFGVMDSVEGKGYKHGQIIGIPVHDHDWYVDALDYIEKCFNKGEHNAARACIRQPKFIEVIDKNSEEQRFIVEVDIVPHSSSVRGKVLQVTLPKFNEKSNKVSQEKKAYYRRVGAKSEIVSEDDIVLFIQGLQEVDARREKAESNSTCEISAPKNLTNKIDLLTGGKEYMDETLWYILVTNKCESHHLTNFNFLMRLKIFCVFDFDANSDKTGLCSKYKEHHARNIHSLTDYAKESGMSMSDLRKSLGLFDQTSWIFCNGNSNYRGGDEPLDENTWIKTKKKHLIKAVSLICDEIFPRGSLVVVFLLLSPVEKPIVDTFHVFYEQMSGMEDIICIAENKEYYEKWANLAQASCDIGMLEQRSIAGVQLSHINSTIQSKFYVGNSVRNLPVSSKGLCVLETPAEERMHSLEILCVNECNDTNLDLLSKEEVKELEGTFYRGGKISWKHLWLAEQKICGDFIERDACNKLQQILNGILHENTVKLPVARMKIFHHPGSGGSTVARQVMWKNRNILRCAIVKSSYLFSTVSQHAVKLRAYDENNVNLCLPVLLLVEDCEEDYLDDLRHDLTEAMVFKKIVCSKPCFILMSCKRSNAPEDLFKTSPSDTVVITHKLSPREKNDFSTKANELEKKFPSPELILTFVLMSREFDEQYVKDFVQNVMKGIDQSSDVTRLMRYVALLNCYVQNSYISVSHCEAYLGLFFNQEDHHQTIREHNFKSYLFKSTQARLLLIELREKTTWISSIHIIHPLVAKEVLNQLTVLRPQSEIAKDLLEEKVLLQHRFGRDEFIKFIRDLFLRRYRKSRGDSVDTFFSPLIEHVCDIENDKEKAVMLLKAAYEQFDKNPFLAQQLARLYYTHEKFDEAKKWAETAKSQLPDNPLIIHTEGQVYKKQFNVILDKKNNLTPAEVIKLIDIGLKSMECFRVAQKAAKSEVDSMNNSGYTGEVDVGCRLLQMLSSQHVFSKNSGTENKELLNYLCTDYIPEDIKEPWFKLHGRLKGLYQNIYNALEWIADDVGYFQCEKIDDGEQPNRVEEHVYSPRAWLLRKTKVFAKFFSSELSYTGAGRESQLVRKMNIYKLGGGSTATIISILSHLNDDRSAKKLENIIDLYPADVAREVLDDVGLANYIMSHIALGCVCPSSLKLLPFQELRELSKRFLNTKKLFPPSAYLLIFLLYWPDENVDGKPDANKDIILTNALQTAKSLHGKRIKDIPVRKKRTNVLFFLGKGYGLQKIMQRSKIEKQIAGPLNEKRMKWDNDVLSKTDSVHRLLRNVPGWTENGKLYARGHCQKNKIEILTMNVSSVPYGNENVTFNLGFTFIGYVAYNIQVETEVKG
ncbi:sterile alpha motif domain-containing protein 9-like [Mixophyes fleayi]|uniref:sterile alpha motif domain-containing protein 9-like n=1 Tax=Mixophyes fleayi TaxID=3061075 RepID=UPI003F4DAD31